MNENEAFRLRSAKYPFVIRDMYPYFECPPWYLRIFGVGYVNPHQAWSEGYEFAWNLIEKRIQELERQ